MGLGSGMRNYSVGDRVALDLPGDPNDGLEGEIISVLPLPWYAVRWSNGFVVNYTSALLKDAEEPYEYEGPTCSICDGLGHGYPGGPPCPLEQRGEEGVPWWAQ